MRTEEKNNDNNNNRTVEEENTSIKITTTIAKSRATTKKNKSSFSSSSYRIFLVDDDHDILISIKKGLEDYDFIVDTFSNPLQAISAFQPELYDLLLIDIKMPHMNGFELYQELRKKANNVDIKTCFITGYEIYYETLKNEFPGLNVGCFISKPIGINDLVNKINKELEQ